MALLNTMIYQEFSKLMPQDNPERVYELSALLMKKINEALTPNAKGGCDYGASYSLLQKRFSLNPGEQLAAQFFCSCFGFTLRLEVETEYTYSVRQLVGK